MSDIDINIEDYGFTTDDVDLIIFSINTNHRNFKFENEDDYKTRSEDYLETSIQWLIDDDELDINKDTDFNKSLKYIARQIAINMFLMLDVNQLDTIKHTENSSTIPSNKAEIITPAIQVLLEPYYKKNKNLNDSDKNINIVGRTERDYGF